MSMILPLILLAAGVVDAPAEPPTDPRAGEGRPLQEATPAAVGEQWILVDGQPLTVTVTGRGKGGRAQEFAAAAALEIAGRSKTWVAAIGTDGTDGPTDVAGAVVSGDTVACAQRKHIDLRAALKHNDTYPALKQLGCHIHTGPTGTNVNDLYLLLLL